MLVSRRREVATCAGIKRLRHANHAPTDAELQDAALQFVRKISRYHTPSRANAKAFDAAVRDVARAGRRLFDRLEVRPQPVSRT